MLCQVFQFCFMIMPESFACNTMLSYITFKGVCQPADDTGLLVIPFRVIGSGISRF